VKPFELRRPDSPSEALADALVPGADVRYIAGGTTMVDLMRLNVERPDVLVDINHLGLGEIERTADGGVRFGALTRNADVARHPAIQREYPALSQALLAGASAQLRNAATTGGNVLQRTRCIYFRDAHAACNKRDPGSGCPALDGYHRNLAVLGTSAQCIATNPSDMNVALVALDAIVSLQSVDGERTVAFADFHLEPGDTPERETVLRPGELIVAVSLPPARPRSRSYYVKLRDRASYEFALASTAVAMTFDGTAMRDVRLALGGVATRPWPATESAQLLEGRTPDPALFAEAADIALRGAVGRPQNRFKIELAKRCIASALAHVTSAGYA
jgi:xanthine dehydrogenase YagS FAD-binding subunit